MINSTPKLQSNQGEMPSLDNSSAMPAREQALGLDAGSKRTWTGKLVENVGHKLALATAVLGIGVAEKAEGAAIANSSLLPNSYALGNTVDQAVWINAVNSSGQTYAFSGILVRGQQADWVITAGHPLTTTTWTANYSSITVGNGSSYLTDRGSMSSVSQMILDYNVNLGHGTGAPADMTFLQLTDRISTPGMYFNIAPTPGLNQPITFASYGLPFSMAEGTIPNAGHVMGVTGLYSGVEPIGYSSTLYDSGFYNPGDPASGIETAGASGGFVGAFNQSTASYDTFGMTVAGSSGASYFLNFNAPGIGDRINQITMPEVVPEPTTFAIAGAALATLLITKKRK